MARLCNLLILLSLISMGSCAINFVKDLLQYNFFGVPVLHKETAWDFDPDVGVRRSRQYQELNGKFGEKAIERLGLGTDGYDQERLAQQITRDQGHLQGLNAYLP